MWAGSRAATDETEPIAVGAPWRDVLDRARGGDVEAFRQLFDRYHDRLYRYALIRLDSPEEASDAVQDVFLSIWRGLPSFTYHHEGSFPAWLFRIAGGRITDRLRHRGRHPSVPLDSVPERSVEFEGHVVSRGSILEALGQLPARQREAVVLRFLIGLPVREVALSMGKSERAVTSLQTRGLKALRRYIGRGDEDQP
jgi:RNA polymerase sigma-70 factor (ECF subfamily)